MAITAATLMVKVGADIDGARRGLAQVGTLVNRAVTQPLNNLQQRASSVQSAFTRVFQGVAIGGAVAATGAIYALTRTVGSLATEGLNAYREYERLSFSLTSLSAVELRDTVGGTMNMADAMKLSEGRAKELLGWVEKLAIASPFKSEDISNSLRLGMAYGFTSEQAMRLTEATVDFVSGTGQTGESMNRIALALGQIQARGKVSAQELNQLSEAGVNARKILSEAFGVTTAQITEMIEGGLIPADLAIEAIVQSMEKDFAGAAAAQANTFDGLISSLQELKTINLREFFTPVFKEAQPYLADLVATLQDPAIREAIKGWGEELGKFVGGGLAKASEVAKQLQQSFDAAGGGANGFLKVLTDALAPGLTVKVTPEINWQYMPGKDGAISFGGGAGKSSAFEWMAGTVDLPARLVLEKDIKGQMSALGIGDWTWTFNGKITTITWGDQMITGTGDPVKLSAQLVGDAGANWLETQSKAAAGWLDDSAANLAATFTGLIWPPTDSIISSITSLFSGLHWPTITMPDWVNRLFGLSESGLGYTPGGSHNFSRNPKASDVPADIMTTPGFASGTNSAPGGLAIVGEEGPELVNLRRGAQVIPNPQTMQMLQNLGIPGYADGTGGTSPWPVQAPRVDLSLAREIGKAFKGEATGVGKAFKDAANRAAQAFESAVRGAPGLFDASPVTADQMRMAELGVPQNFADDYLRRLTDEVVNGVDWAGVDIGDAAQRAGIDPSLPAQAILEMFSAAWSDSSLFANPANLDLINKDAVQAAIARQQAATAGEANILALFGITPESSGAVGSALSGALASGITPETMAPVGQQAMTGIVQGMQGENSDASTGIATALTTQFGALTDEQKTAISSGLAQSVAGGIGKAVEESSLAGNWIGALGATFDTADAIEALKGVGKAMVQGVWRGWVEAVSTQDWYSNWPLPPATTGAPTTPTTGTPGLASGTPWWRGGLTWVGENGPELLNLPRGSAVLSNDRSMALLASGADSSVNVTVQASVDSNIDVERLAYRVLDVLKRRKAI